MTIEILVYLVCGACFGLASYRWQHLFSEGPTRRGEPGGGPDLAGRLMWAMVCTFLWPLMLLTGLYSAVRLASRSRVQARDDDQR